jgi:CRISPR-associated protein (TIGR03984 family)
MTSTTVQATCTFDHKLDLPLVEHFLKWADAYRFSYLLAHADDGVIWGHFSENTLVTSCEVAPKEADSICPDLDPVTLQQARLFGSESELLLWRTSDGWSARLIEDASKEIPTWTEAFDDRQLLWGTHGRTVGKGFIYVRELGQGLRQVLPPVPGLPASDKEDRLTRWPCLTVRHYISPLTPDHPEARIQASRLTGLTTIKAPKSSET